MNSVVVPLYGIYIALMPHQLDVLFREYGGTIFGQSDYTPSNKENSPHNVMNVVM